MGTKKIIWFVIAVVVLGFLMIGYGLLFRPKSQPKPAAKPIAESKNAVDATKKVSENVPEIVTNPAQKVPEVNPFDRANPYKYVNPLR